MVELHYPKHMYTYEVVEEQMSKVLFIDGLNMFIRSYIVNPNMDKHGNPIGGCIGFLKSLQKVVEV
jgi:5'-3' exonuclease